MKTSLPAEKPEDFLFGGVDWKTESVPFDGAEFAREWYVEIPHSSSRRFIPFLISSRELARYIFPKKYLQFRITGSTKTALADVENSTIWLPEKIFDPDVSDQDYGPTVTAVMNGLILHEAAHFAQSPPKIIDCWDTFRKSKYGEILPPELRVKSSLRIPDTLAALINLVEDLYIEAWIEREFSPMYPFIESAHEFFFTDEELDNRIKAFEEAEPTGDELEDEKVSQLEEKLALLNILIMMKNQRFMRSAKNGYVAWFVEKFKEAQTADEAAYRGRIAFDCFMKLFEFEMSDLNVVSIATEFGEMADPLDQYDENGREVSVDDPKARSMPLEGNPEEEAERERTKVSISEAHNKRNVEEEERETGKRLFGSVPPLRVNSDIRVRRPPGPNELIMPEFAALGRKLRYAWTSNYAPGPAHKRGPRLINQRLYRIATDQKIFSYREKMKATGKNYEICILIDASGSMAGHKIEEAVSAGFSAWRSLRAARVASSLMAHTSHIEGSRESPILHVIADYDEKNVEKVRGRAAMMREYGLALYNNYDGFAIAGAVAHGFTPLPDRRRYLFVISDGEPAGRDYYGPNAVEHTKSEVEKARARGIDVISITVSIGAYKVNDHIYGPKKNVKVNSPAVLENLIEAMFIKGGK